jgi:hypothetical protein
MQTQIFIAMKKFISCLFLALFLPFIVVSQPTEEEILASIDLGTAWLVAEQNADGSWGTWSGEPFESMRVAYTGFVLTKLCDRAYEHYFDSPFDPEYEYVDNVVDGFDFLFEHAITPEEVDGVGILFLEGIYDHHEIYNAAVALMAFASSYTPDRVINYPANPLIDGLTFAQLVDQMVLYFDWAQWDDDPLNPHYGGWRYEPNYTNSDNSHTGYVVLGLRYAEAFGATIPQNVKDELSVYIDNIQNDQGPGDDGFENDPDGGSGYAVASDWVNQLKTGNLLFEMSFVGDDLGALRVEYALDYIARHYWDAGGGIFDIGWDDHNQAMFCLMKGFESLSIETIEVGGADRNWFDDFATDLLERQDPTGFWPPDAWGNDIVLATVWALFVLEKVAPPPPVVYVDFDVHPTSWPNPINTKSQGLTPTAILGTEDFDVTTIDPATLFLDLPLGMVYPTTWAMEDVTQPAGNEWECNDTEEGPDGYMDLTVKFNTQELVTALGEVNDGDQLVIVIKGNLVGDGQAIEGDDCILIKKKGNKTAEMDSPASFTLAQNYPNPFSSTTTIEFQLPEASYVQLKVYNVAGMELNTLADGQFNAGNYSLTLDATNLPKGIYIYKIVTSDHTATRQMLVSE